MPCYYPREAWKRGGGVVFAVPGEKYGEFQIPCGRCVGCKLELSRQWAVRCMHEAQMHESSYFVLLTYDDDHLPSDYSLNHRDFQLFMKKLRKTGQSVRYYMCGEYGERTSRPHYHACLFGLRLDDLDFWKNTDSGHRLYVSKFLTDTWGLGKVEIGMVTFESAAYVARYCVKAVTDPGSEWVVDPDSGELFERKREYTRMSLKPGIGATWFAKYKSEVFPLDRVVARGREMKPPKYYDRLLEKETGTVSDDIGYSRYLRSLECKEDNTQERLLVKDTIAKARLNQYKRSG